MISVSSLNTPVTRGNSLKLNKPRSRLNIKQTFFSQRVVNDWNTLPELIISSISMNGFKTPLTDSFGKFMGFSMTQSLNPYTTRKVLAVGITCV